LLFIIELILGIHAFISPYEEICRGINQWNYLRHPLVPHACRVMFREIAYTWDKWIMCHGEIICWWIWCNLWSCV